jgi:hypothetical protein
MSLHQKIWIFGILCCCLSAAWGQDNPTPTPDSGQSQEPVPAYGQEGAPPPISQNPPLSGLDLPSLEPHAAPLSYLQPGATFSESESSNIANTTGGSSTNSITRALGSLTLRRLWSNYDLALDYAGGAAYYNVNGLGWKALQQLDVDQKISWKRGNLSLRDSFSYLPEGNFGGSYGSLGSSGVQGLGGTAFGSFWGGTALGTLGLAPRVMNVSLVDVSETLTPKSAVTAAGGYAFTHFYGSQPNGSSFFGSSQISAQGAYNRILSAHTQVALVYGYQGFDFSAFATSFHSQVIEAMYGHRISGRMDLLIAAGPQITKISLPCNIIDLFEGVSSCHIDQSGQISGSVPDTRIGAAGQARLRYRFPRTSLDLRYEHFLTSGSGVFAGAETDLARVSATRPLNRVWTVGADLGFTRNSRVQSLSTAQQSTCNLPGAPNPNPQFPTCPGVSANVYEYGFIGLTVHRQFGRSLHGYLSTEFNQIWFDHGYCGGLPECNRTSNREVITIGLDWTPRPIRLD